MRGIDKVMHSKHTRRELAQFLPTKGSHNKGNLESLRQASKPRSRKINQIGMYYSNATYYATVKYSAAWKDLDSKKN